MENFIMRVDHSKPIGLVDSSKILTASEQLPACLASKLSPYFSVELAIEFIIAPCGLFKVPDVNISIFCAYVLLENKDKINNVIKIFFIVFSFKFKNKFELLVML
jgi:hypothetical protein